MIKYILILVILSSCMDESCMCDRVTLARRSASNWSEVNRAKVNCEDEGVLSITNAYVVYIDCGNYRYIR